ncbi:ATP-binding protein [Arabiibacter massiliensis]|uniref:ATP-binding protein n=1 Tax=Arabiibacter massiliensis TaxID=1870985 RepID=UPI0009BBC3A8|nr:ATP-binding protein [Arabiibacter massiliensis]
MAANPLGIYPSLVREYMEFMPPRLVARNDIVRSLPEPAPFNLVHIITGVRRCGKTFYLFQLMKNLMENGVSRSDIFYFNFADDRLKPLSATVLDDTVSEYFRQVPAARSEGAYLFLDEVQEAENWQGFCQRMAELENVTLVITGSSSKLSSEEIATSFRGRSHAHEMAPLSFREFCEFNGVPAPGNGSESVSPRTETSLESAFDRFLVCGGFPGVQTLEQEDRIEILQSYVRDVVARDVAERFGREDIALANQLALFGLRNTACEFSVNNMVEQLQDAGYKVYWEKVNRLFDLLKQAFMLHELAEYSTALKSDTTAVPKVYAVDPGIVYAVSRANQQDIGKRLETAVYLELRRRMAGRRTETVTSLTLGSPQRAKVDFLVGDALAAEPYALYQVTASMESEKTRNREIHALDEAMARLGLENGTIVTLREEGTVAAEHGTIRMIPAWKWALG